MTELEKLFRKISPKDQAKLLGYMKQLQISTSDFQTKKLTGTDFYRARKGRFRFIFHYTKDERIKIDAIRLRDEKTYKAVSYTHLRAHETV